MRYTFTFKPTKNRHFYGDEKEALLSFQRMFGSDLNHNILLFLVAVSNCDFTYEDENYILKGKHD